VCLCLGGLVGLAYTLGWLEEYTASALLLVHGGNVTGIRVLTAPPDPVGYEAYYRAQPERVRSRLVLSAALRDRHVVGLPIIKNQPDPIGWLQQHIDVDYVGGSEIMRIALRGKNEQELIALVNAVTDAYLSEIISKEHIERMQRVEQLKGMLMRQLSSLRDKRKTLGYTFEVLDGPPLFQQQKVCQELSARTRQEIADYRSQLRSLTMKLRAQESLQEAAEPMTIADFRAKWELALIREQIAYVTKFIEVLEDDEKWLEEGDKKMNARFLDLEIAMNRIAQMDAVRKRIGAEIQTKEVELMARPRVVLVEPATVVHTWRFFPGAR
jgi:hypothetical protein